MTDFPDDPQLIDESPWRCVGDQAPLAAATGSLAVAGGDTATVKVQICDALGDCSLPLPGLSGKLCTRLDVGCTQPLLSGALRRGGTRVAAAALLALAGFVLALLAFIPLVGFVEAAALPILAARLRRREPSRHAGLRILARD